MFKIEWPDLDFPPINLLSLGREDSPCQSKCTLNSTGDKCSGCLRTVDEITDWSILDPHERFQIIDRIYHEDPLLFRYKKDHE